MSLVQFQVEKVSSFLNHRIELKKSPKDLWGFSCCCVEGDRLSRYHSVFSYASQEVAEFHGCARAAICEVEGGSGIRFLSFFDSDRVIAQSEDAIAFFGVGYLPPSVKVGAFFADPGLRELFKQEVLRVGVSELMTWYRNSVGEFFFGVGRAELLRVGRVDFLLESIELQPFSS